MYGTGILLFAESDKAAWSHKEMRRILPHRYESKPVGNSEACWASSIAARVFRVAIEVRLIAGLIFKVPPAQSASAVN